MINRKEVFASSTCNTVKSYINGNYIVNLFPGHTRQRRALRVGEEFKASFPDSIDIKITNQCKVGCPYCHESSWSGGIHFDLGDTIRMLDQLPKVGIEVAIGGGDVTELPEDILLKFINWLLSNNFYPRLTISYKSLRKFSQSKALVKHVESVSSDNRIALGVSIESIQGTTAVSRYIYYNVNVVYHVVIGVFNVEEFLDLVKDNRKILILGYKQFGRASKKPLDPEVQKRWKEVISDLIFNQRCGIMSYNYYLAFDNLAIEQLGLRDSLLDIEWRGLYLGEEFTSSMYVDAVEKTFAKTSRDYVRTPWSDTKGILDYFNGSGK